MRPEQKRWQVAVTLPARASNLTLRNLCQKCSRLGHSYKSNDRGESLAGNVKKDLAHFLLGLSQFSC